MAFSMPVDVELLRGASVGIALPVNVQLAKGDVVMDGQVPSLAVCVKLSMPISELVDQLEMAKQQDVESSSSEGDSTEKLTSRLHELAKQAAEPTVQSPAAEHACLSHVCSNLPEVDDHDLPGIWRAYETSTCSSLPPLQEAANEELVADLMSAWSSATSTLDELPAWYNASTATCGSLPPMQEEPDTLFSGMSSLASEGDARPSTQVAPSISLLRRQGPRSIPSLTSSSLAPVSAGCLPPIFRGTQVKVFNVVKEACLWTVQAVFEKHAGKTVSCTVDDIGVWHIKFDSNEAALKALQLTGTEMWGMTMEVLPVEG